MTRHATHRFFVALAATLFLTLLISPALPQPVTPKSVKTGTSASLTLNSSGFFDLSRVTTSQIAINPSTGVSNLALRNGTPQSAALTFDLAATALTGPRAIVITTDDVTVSIKLMVERGTAPVCTAGNCRPPRECNGNVCDLAACGPSNCRPPKRCTDDGLCMRPPICSPTCRPPKECQPGNVCRLPR
jgi:hypothetical protein